MAEMKVVCVKDSSSGRGIAQRSDPVNQEFANAMLGRSLDFSAEEHVDLSAVDGGLSLPQPVNFLGSGFTLDMARKYHIKWIGPTLACAHQAIQQKASAKGPVQFVNAVSGCDDGSLADSPARTGLGMGSMSGLRCQEPGLSKSLQLSVGAVPR